MRYLVLAKSGAVLEKNGNETSSLKNETAIIKVTVPMKETPFFNEVHVQVKYFSSTHEGPERHIYVALRKLELELMIQQASLSFVFVKGPSIKDVRKRGEKGVKKKRTFTFGSKFSI